MFELHVEAEAKKMNATSLHRVVARIGHMRHMSSSFVLFPSVCLLEMENACVSLLNKQRNEGNKCEERRSNPKP